MKKHRLFASVVLVLASIVCACLAVLAQQQADPAAIVRSQESQDAGLAATWLGSGDPRMRAWGAYLALRDQRKELLPPLLVLVDAHRVRSAPFGPPERDEHDAMLAVLDAAIQMGGLLSAEKAARLYPEFPVQTTIFLARAGSVQSASVLLDIFQQEPNPPGTWLAVGNMLVIAQPPGFAAAVLKGLTVDAGVRIVDSGSSGPPSMGVGASCAGGMPSPRPGWPPIGNYVPGGTVLLAWGTDPAYYSREVGGTYSDARSGTGCPFRPNLDVLRAHFLSRLAHDQAESPSIRSYVNGTIQWLDDAQYQRDLRAFIDQQQAVFDKLGLKLMGAGVLSPEERVSARPSLRVTLSDARSRKTSGLPALQNPGANVRIVN